MEIGHTQERYEGMDPIGYVVAILVPQKSCVSFSCLRKASLLIRDCTMQTTAFNLIFIYLCILLFNLLFIYFIVLNLKFWFGVLSLKKGA